MTGVLANEWVSVQSRDDSSTKASYQAFQPPIKISFSKLWYTYTMEYYTAERKKDLLPFSTAWMQLESIMLSEIRQAVKDKYHMISPLTGT